MLRAKSPKLIDMVEPLGWRARLWMTPSASAHIVALRHPTLDAVTVRRRLHDEHHVITSARLGAIRVSLHVYNDSSDIAALADALALLGGR
jgi:selenocysteine lyase/cysteine desulfurase